MRRRLGKKDGGHPSVTCSLQDRLSRDTDARTLAALDAYGAHYGRAERTFLSRSSRKVPINKGDFCRRFGLTSRQYNALSQGVGGMLSSRASNLPNYLYEARTKLGKVERKIVSKRERLGQIKAALAREECPTLRKEEKKLYRELRSHWRKVDCLKARADRLDAQVKDKGAPRICLGSRRLFRAQYALAENGLRDHKHWRERWRSARDNAFMVMGSKDEAAGCQGCVIARQEDGTYSLTLRLPNALQGKFGHHVALHGLRFGYQNDVLEAAIDANLERKAKAQGWRAAKRKGLVQGSEAEALADYGQAITYRFVRDPKRGWRVILSTQKMVTKEKATDRANGAIGIDFNEHHLSVCEIDAQGNRVPKGCRDHLFRDYDSSSAQNLTQLQTLAKKVVAEAHALGKPLVIEDLNFRLKRAALTKGKNPRGNKTVSALAYRAFRAAIERNAALKGVEVIAVNPAYTSVLGALKYANQCDFSTHRAAALVIARRGLGFKEVLPRQTFIRKRGTVRTFAFTLPEDKVKDDQGCLRGLPSWLARCRKTVEGMVDGNRLPNPAGASP